jgi:hypothetical protein
MTGSIQRRRTPVRCFTDFLPNDGVVEVFDMVGSFSGNEVI